MFRPSQFFLTVLLFWPLAACRSESVDCGSVDTKTLVIKIVRESETNRLLAEVLPRLSAQREVSEAFQKKTAEIVRKSNEQLQSLQAERNKLYTGPALKAARQAGMTVSPEADVLWRQMGKVDQEREANLKVTRDETELQLRTLKNKAAADARYELTAIRTKRKNAEIGVVACEAFLGIELEGFKEQAEVDYQIERTADGDLYGRVFGL